MSDIYGIDTHKLVYHPRRVADLAEGADEWESAKQVYPLYIEIAPVGACNHRCTFCAVDYIGYQSRRLDADRLAEVVDEMGRLGVRSIMYAGEGEPLLHSRIADIAQATKQAGIDVSFTTNATVLPKGFLERGLPVTSWLKASINAGTAETYARVHRTKKEDFRRVLENLEAMTSYRERHGLDVTLGAQVLWIPENTGELHTLAALVRDIGLDYLVVKPYSQHPFSETQLYRDVTYERVDEFAARFRELETERFGVVFRERTMRKYQETIPYRRCYATPFVWAYVMASGAVYSCSVYLEDERFELGNINRKSFRAIWEGERRQANHAFVRDELDASKVCRRNCRMDEANRYLHKVIDADVPHINFI